MSYKWFGGEFLEKLEKEEAQRLKRASIFLTNEVKKQLGTKSPPHSDPGEYPHLETGELRRSIAWEVDDKALIGRVGTNKIYGRYLEKGTNNMEERPFLQPTLEANQSNIVRILGKKIKQG